MLNAGIRGKLFFGSTTELEKVGAEPDLFNVSLMTGLCDDLLNSIFFLALLVLSQPH